MADEIIEATKKYIEKGLKVFPVKQDKTPGTPNGFKNSAGQITEFEKYYRPGYGIGIPTGHENNIYIIDLDVEKDQSGKPLLDENGHNINTGEIEFCTQLNITAPLKELKTPVVKTQSGGTQIYYKLSPNRAILRNHTSVLKKVDLRGEGGYVVAPPSKGSYGQYEFLNDTEIAFMPVNVYNWWLDLELPDDSNEQIIPVNLNDYNMDIVVRTIAQIFKHPNGHGNELLMAFSGAMALRGVSLKFTESILNEAAISNAWPVNKINRATISDSYKKLHNHQKLLGYTTLKKLVTENNDQYPDYAEIINNLEEIFEKRNNIFYMLDKSGNKHFDKAKSIAYIQSKFQNLYTDEFDIIYNFAEDHGWETNFESDLASYIQRLDSSLSEHNIDEIISGIKHITYDKEFKNHKLPNELIPLDAGLFNIETKTLEKHLKDYFYSSFSRHYIPGVKESELEFSHFLDNILINPEKDKKTVYQTICGGLLNENNIQGMLVFYGDGRNGKGIIQNDIITPLIGRDNIVMPDLNRIASYPFELTQLINKKIIFFSETVKGANYYWEILKRITGHDYENIPVKNKPSIQYQYSSEVILSTNSLLPPKDELAIWGRIINIVEFSNYLHSLKSEEISEIVLKLKDENELDRLFSFVIENVYPEFMHAGFTNKYDLATAKEKYLIKSNPAITYLKIKESRGEILTVPRDVLEYSTSHGLNQDLCYSVDKNGNETVFAIKANLIKQVNSFCCANHLPKYDEADRLSQIKIGQAIHSLGYEVQNLQKYKNGKRIWAWTGIFVMPDDTEIRLEEGHDGTEAPGNNQVNSKAIENREKADTAGLPPGAVREELEQYKADKEWIRDHEKELNANDGGKHIETSKYKPEYYQVLKDFDIYNESYFYDSTLICESLRKIPKKGSSETAFVLLKLLIPPGKSTKFPEGWNHFITDQRIVRHLHSESEFNALSRGGAQ